MKAEDAKPGDWVRWSRRYMPPHYHIDAGRPYQIQQIYNGYFYVAHDSGLDGWLAEVWEPCAAPSLIFHGAEEYEEVMAAQAAMDGG